MKIGISGSVGVGKTSLAHALSRQLGLPRIEEEMRAHLTQRQFPLAQQPPHEIARVLETLWRDRKLRENAMDSFVADNSSLDFAAYALYYDCLDHENAMRWFHEPLRQSPVYDLVVVLPWGALLYEQDGIRPANPYSQMRYQLLIEALVAKYLPAEKILVMPAFRTSLNDRVEAVLKRIKLSHRDRNIWEEGYPLSSPPTIFEEAGIKKWGRLMAGETMSELRSGGVRKVCSECGREFPCYSGQKTCWCFDLPPIMPFNTGADCLCESCLRKAITSRQRNS